MKRRLVLIRHSKAVQGEPGEIDHERQLADRGIADAVAVGRWLVDSGIVPDRVVVSTGLRARQTWDFAAEVLDRSPEVVADHRMYVNTVGSLLAIIHETPPEVATLAMVGHNPSMAELAYGLEDGDGDEGARTAIARSYPTSGVACFDVPRKWAKLELAGATLTAFAVPRA
jgi:phosphohistidine phosphatase